MRLRERCCPTHKRVMSAACSPRNTALISTCLRTSTLVDAPYEHIFFNKWLQALFIVDCSAQTRRTTGLLPRDKKSSRCCFRRARKEIVSRNADPLIHKRITFSLIHYHLESGESVLTDTPHLVTTVVWVSREHDVADANSRTAERRSAQAILVKTLPDRLSRPYRHYGFRLLVVAAPVVFVIDDPRIANIDITFVAVEV